MAYARPSGWVPDPKKDKDLHARSPKIQKLLTAVGVPLPGVVNLQEGFPPVYDQGSINSCTANALAGLIDYFEMKTAGRCILPSRLFIYKTTRNLLQTNAEVGAYLRTALEAVTLFGSPSESYWPYQPNMVNVEPPAFIYGLGQKYNATSYYRYDPDGVSKEEVLSRIRTNLAAGLPSAFGFFMFESITAAEAGGDIPYPGPNEKSIGGHAVVAVGYDDHRIIKGASGNTKGALRIRNSWGPQWGDQGYGWLPYEYVLRSLAIDWWSILRMNWFDQDNPLFTVPAAITPGKAADPASGKASRNTSS